MSQAPSISRFFAEDYRDAPAWFRTKFIATLNSFAFPVATALRGNLGAENLNVQYFTTQIAGSATATNNKVSFQTTVVGTVHGVTIMQVSVLDKAVPTYLAAAPAVASWTVSGPQITVQSISGLADNTNYQITFKVE